MDVVKNKRKRRNGVVVSNKMEKTVVVKVGTTMRHPRYEKVIKVEKKYYAHTDAPLKEGDQVTIEETRPLSKLKRWRVVP
jgi:small subunit ribosomal protein S17